MSRSRHPGGRRGPAPLDSGVRRNDNALRRIDIVTLFPSMFEGPLSESLIGKARERGVIEVQIHPLRDFAAPEDRHHAVDDRPYGGGAGMVLQAEPIFKALQFIRKKAPKGLARRHPHVIYMSPQGRRLTQAVAASFLQKPWIVILCGHYEGIDQRIFAEVDEEISIGDVVLTGGEIPAMALVDAVVRLMPTVVKEADSILHDSFQQSLLDHPHYTRPALWRGKKVPAVLMSGDHAAIAEWRREQALQATRKKRPDLLTKNGDVL